jgi:hypothetical protein
MARVTLAVMAWLNCVPRARRLREVEPDRLANPHEPHDAPEAKPKVVVRHDPAV